MTIRTLTRRAALAAAVLLVGGLVLPRSSGAAVGASAAGTQQTSTPVWAAVATQSTADPPPSGALTLTFSKSASQYFRVDNTGTVDLTGVTYIVAVSGGTPTETLSLTACSVAWVGTHCSAGAQAAGQWSSSTSGTAQPSAFAPGAPLATVYVQASIGGKFAPTTATISVEVSSSNPRQIRAASTAYQ